MLRSGRRSLWRPRTLRTVGTWRTIPLGLMEPGRRSLVGRWATVHWRRALHARRSHPWGRHRSTHTLRRGHDHPRWAVLVVTWGTRWVLMRMMALATASVWASGPRVRRGRRPGLTLAFELVQRLLRRQCHHWHLPVQLLFRQPLQAHAHALLRAQRNHAEALRLPVCTVLKELDLAEIAYS